MPIAEKVQRPAPSAADRGVPPAGDALVRSRATLELVERVAHVGSWEWNLESGQVCWSNELFRLFGVEPGQLTPTHQALLKRVHPEDRVLVEQATAAVRSGADLPVVEFRAILPDGSVRWLHVKGDLECDVDGASLRLIGTAQDITQRKQSEKQLSLLERQLRQAQKMESVGELTGGIAHDFNNVLSVIIANAQLVASAGLASERDQSYEMSEILQAAQRAATMVKKLLGFSRHAEVKLGPINLVEISKNLSSMLRRIIPENIEIAMVVDANVGAVRADVGAIEQILINLATNSRDAMPDGGVFRIEVKEVDIDPILGLVHPLNESGKYVQIAVSDTGIGMDKETKARIFDPFFTTKAEGVGTGLGMAMVYSLTKQQGGFVHVYSELGCGTMIKLHFPVTGGEVRAAENDQSLTDVRGGTETILLVEDEEALRRIGRRVLEKFGYTVLVAADGEEAWDTYQQHASEVDLVVSDLVMPRLGGKQLYEVLHREFGAVRFLFASGYAERAARERDALDPSIPFVSKPWTVPDLLRSVREALDREVMV